MFYPRPKPLKKLTAEVEAFNAKYSVGDTVKLRLDSGEIRETHLRHEAFVASGTSAVAFFEGISGYYLINRVV